MSAKEIITDKVMVPLVLVVLIGGFAMNIKAVESRNADLSKKLDLVQAELAAIKKAQKNLVVRAAPTPDTRPAARDKATPPADAGDKTGDKTKSDDDQPDNPPL